MNHFFLVIRKLTVAPIMAAITLTLLFLFSPEIFASGSAYFLSLFFLGILPLLAYPAQKYIPAYKKQGRNGQRTLAMFFAVSGYILGILFGLLLHAPKPLILIYLEYLLSGLLILLFNKCFHIKLSGHACGIFAPILLFLYFGQYLFAFIGLIAAVFICYASLYTKRHTWQQLAGGSIIPGIVLFAIFLFF